LSVTTVSPKVIALGRWGEVSLFSIDLTVFQNFLASEPQDANLSRK